MKKSEPFGFIGKDILAIEKEIKPIISDSRDYRLELAREFRQAAEALRIGMVQEGDTIDR